MTRYIIIDFEVMQICTLQNSCNNLSLCGGERIFRGNFYHHDSLLERSKSNVSKQRDIMVWKQEIRSLIRYCAGTVLMTNPGKAAAHLLNPQESWKRLARYSTLPTLSLWFYQSDCHYAQRNYSDRYNHRSYLNSGERNRPLQRGNDGK